MQGLTSEEVIERKKAGLFNKPVISPSKPIWKIIFDNVFTYFNAVFFGLAFALVSVHAYRDLTFLIVIICNTFIGIIQEIRTKLTLDKLTVLHTQTARVLRDKKISSVPINELVKDDIVEFKAGDQIPADGKVIDGEVTVNESLITGEPDEIAKKLDSELLSGSFIVSGKCLARLTKVGADSYISKLTLKAKSIKSGEQSEILRSLNHLVKLAGIAIIPVGLALFGQEIYIKHATLAPSVQSTSAAVLGMIPEGLFLLASLALALSATRLAKQQVLIHEMKCIETLARIDTLCVDKTGTITSGDMTVHSFIPLSKDTSLEETFRSFVAAFPSSNETIKALKSHFKKPESPLLAEKILDFTSRLKYSGAVLNKKTYILGAPDFTLLSSLKDYESTLAPLERDGYRILAFGTSKNGLEDKPLKNPITPLAFIVLENPIRRSAKKTFAYFRDQGVDIKVISGDNPLTVSAVALRAGISNAEQYLDASRLKTDADYTFAVKKYTVFGRVTPDQKQKLIKALQNSGHRVAMTGDGVNDVLALKDADCSVAMASGSDAAVQAAQLVLLDSDFSKMPSIVLEGRRVVNNLERSGSLFIVKNVFSLVTAVLTLILGLTYPLLPAQISIISFWTIGAPSFFLSQMPNTSLIKGQFITNILEKAIPAGLVNTLLVFLTIFLCRAFAVPAEELSTACALTLALTSLVYLFYVARPLNRYRAVVVALSTVGIIISFTAFRWAFSLSDQLSITTTLICISLGVIAYPLITLLTKLLSPLISKRVKLRDSKA